MNLKILNEKSCFNCLTLKINSGRQSLKYQKTKLLAKLGEEAEHISKLIILNEDNKNIADWNIINLSNDVHSIFLNGWNFIIRNIINITYLKVINYKIIILKIIIHLKLLLINY